MILLYGSKGNMGRRYAAILRYLGVKWFGVDLDTPAAMIPHERAHGYIIATPTESHIRLMRMLLPKGKPVLCEKPWTTDIAEFREFLKDIGPDERRRLSMIAQYRHLIRDLKASGQTIYNYYKHGSDGLGWDCIQILGFSNGPATLLEDSPVWRCRINGQSLNLAAMDEAYVSDIQAWLRGQVLDLGFIAQAHEKAAAYRRIM